MIHPSNISMMPSQAEINLSGHTEYKDIFLGVGRTCAGCRFFFLPFILLSALLTRGGKQAHSSPCLIHRAATVNVQRGGKDNFSQGRLPGTTLDHRIPSSPFSPFMNKNAVKVYQRKRFCFFYLSQLRKELWLLTPKGMMDSLLAHLSGLTQRVTTVSYRPVCSPFVPAGQ